MSLIENFKDRIPTEVLSNGAIRYEEFNSSGTSQGYKYFKRADEPEEEGNVWNKNVYDGIKDEFGSVVYTSGKATQSQAESGTDNTKWMTPLRVKQFANKNVGVKETKLALSSSGTTTIDLSTYLTENTERLDIVINAVFASSYAPIKINGSSIRVNYGGKIGTSVSSRNVGNVSAVSNALLKIEIYNSEHMYLASGNVGTSSQTENYISETGSYSSLTSVEIGKISSSSTYNYDYQVSIFQYLK